MGSKDIVKFGLKVREIRKSKGFTQEDLAIACDLNISTIQKIESGKYAAGLDVIFTIAKAMKVSVKEFFE